MALVILHVIATESAAPADEAAVDDNGALYERFGRRWYRFAPQLGGREWEPFPLGLAATVTANEARTAGGS